MQIGCGIAIVVIVSEQLWVSWDLTWEGVWRSGSASGNTCFMNTNRCSAAGMLLARGLPVAPPGAATGALWGGLGGEGASLAVVVWCLWHV